MSGHTPGPWKELKIKGPVTTVPYDHDKAEEYGANFRLAMRSPEMAARIEDLEKKIEDLNAIIEGLNFHILLLNSKIAKASGQEVEK
ncbi:MAG: hypothetical protein HQL97_01110 [Magnetococcales bacterium]|nr:hypothetical protein [Magnetococcales bacterium]